MQIQGLGFNLKTGKSSKALKAKALERTSLSRHQRLHSISSAVMGTMACARRIWSAVHSERPTYFTLPSATISWRSHRTWRQLTASEKSYCASVAAASPAADNIRGHCFRAPSACPVYDPYCGEGLRYGSWSPCRVTNTLSWSICGVQERHDCIPSPLDAADGQARDVKGFNIEAL